jgi:hypothetical protein
MNRTEYSKEVLESIQRVEERRLLFPELLAMLEELEWHGAKRDRTYVCPKCGNFESEGHKSNCRIAALIRKAKG